MSTTPPMLPGSGSSTSWWKRPENRTTTIFFVLVAAVAIWFWGLIVPFLLSAAIDTFHFLIVAVALFVTFEIITSKKIHYLAKLVNRWITGWFVAIDPIGIRKNHIEETEKKKAELEESTAEIRGLRLKLKKRLDDNQTAYNESMRLLQAASAVLNNPRELPEKKLRAQRIVASESKHSDGLAGLIAKQQKHAEHYDTVLKVLVRYGEVCDDFILDLKREVDLQQQDMEESRGFAKGMKAAFGIFRGSGVDLEMDEMAREQIEKQYSDRMGEVENFLNLTKDVIGKADFNDEAALSEVQSKLDNWAGNNSQLTIGRDGSTKQEMIAAASSEVLTQTSQTINDKNFK